MTKIQKAAPTDTRKPDHQSTYWKSNIQLLAMLLTIWFVVSFGAGILFVDVLNTISIGGYPLGFWFAQQGSIFTFVVIIFFYVYRMDKIERSYKDDQEGSS